MSEEMIDLTQCTDAKVWAEEFIKTMKRMNWTIDDIDESLMLAWFANAMMAMYDSQQC